MKTPQPLPSLEKTLWARRPNRCDAYSRRVYRLYNAPLSLLLAPLGAYTLWRRYVKKKSGASLLGQWGRVPDDVVEALHGKQSSHMSTHVVWIHAVSVGETIAARPVARALRQAMPDCRLALSVTTDTGFETAQAAKKSGEVDAVFYFPLDTPVAIRRALHRIRPDAFLTMETELWPNFLHLARCRGARTFLVNGRVSDNLLRTAPRLGPIWKWMMRNLDGCLMRSPIDAQRMISLGASSEQVQVTGDVKLDAVASDEAQDGAMLRARWRETLKIASDAPFFVAGSTHAGEEETVLAAFAQLRETIPDLRLLLAPRHIERAPDILALTQRLKMPTVRRSSLDMSTHVAGVSSETPEIPVILLDSVGELGEIYAACDVAFVGGSLIERGGHNVLEPVLRGVPVAFGPHIANFREAARLVESAQGGKMVHHENELVATLLEWLQNADKRALIGGRAREALSQHRGAAHRVARIVADALAPHALAPVE